MTPDEMIAVIQAIKDGKPIQSQRKFTNKQEPWVDSVKDSHPNFHAYNYRVKPAYEPYDAKTLSEAIGKHGYVIKRENKEEYLLILGWNEQGLTTSGRGFAPYVDWDGWVWRDDLSPFGVLPANDN